MTTTGNQNWSLWESQNHNNSCHKYPTNKSRVLGNHGGAWWGCHVFQREVEKNVNQLVTMQKLKSSEVDNYLQANKITSTDVYKYLAADGRLKNYSDMALLFKISLLIPPSNIQQSFLVINLLCTQLRSSLRETNLDRFMRISINGLKSLTDAQCEELLNNFKVMNKNRQLDLWIYFIHTLQYEVMIM